MDLEKLKQSNKAAFKAFSNVLPIIFGILLLISILTNTIPSSFYQGLFTGNTLLDSLIGDILGSILLGNPVTGYIISNELLTNGVSLIAVTTFMVAWVTVGIVQSPVEAKALGKQFTIIRNLSAFVMAMIVAVITVFVVSIL